MAGKKKIKTPKAPKEPKVKKERKPRKETRESPGIGHNVASLRKQGSAFVDRFLKLSDSMASDMAGYRSDFKNLYEKAANDLGLKKSVITKELKRILANKKAAEAEQELPPDEREQIQLWRGAMVGTQFQLFSEGDLAAAPDSAQGDGEPIEPDFAEVD